MAARIVVSRRLPEPALALLREGAQLVLPEVDRPLTAEELRAHAAGADGLIVTILDRIDGELLDAAGPGLRCVANVGVGHDNIDVSAATERGVVVTNTPGVLTDATADLAIALMLAVTRRLGEAERRVRSGEPWQWDLDWMLGRGLSGRTLGIVGHGAIGRATAHRARVFGMKVVYTQRRAATDPGDAERVDLPELLERADVVSLHCPLTPETRHLVDAAALAAMGSESYLINTARGPVVDEAALAEALTGGVIAGAGIDVYEREPEVHPALLAAPNAVLVPHVGSGTIETRTAMAELAARNALAVCAGDAALTPVRP